MSFRYSILGERYPHIALSCFSFYNTPSLCAKNLIICIKFSLYSSLHFCIFFPFDIIGILYHFRLFPAVWVEIHERRHQDSLPFRPISAFWVEIHERRHQDFLPFSPVFRYLGRDLQPAAPGFSTLFGRFPLFR